MSPPEGRPTLKGIPGFRDAASPVSVTYSDRCRMIGAEVAARCARIADASATDEGADARAWLEARLAEAVSTPSAVAGAMLLGAALPGRPDDLEALRVAVWLRLDRPEGQLWRGGPESQGIWSLLLSATPTDEHALWWLAASHRVATERLDALIRRRPPTSSTVPGAGRGEATGPSSGPRPLESASKRP